MLSVWAWQALLGISFKVLIFVFVFNLRVIVWPNFFSEWDCSWWTYASLWSTFFRTGLFLLALFQHLVWFLLEPGCFCWNWYLEIFVFSPEKPLKKWHLSHQVLWGCLPGNSDLGRFYVVPFVKVCAVVSAAKCKSGDS